MYKITCGDFVIHENGNPKLLAFDITLSREINTAGTLKFSIPLTHEYYEQVNAGNVIRMYCNNALKFIGEVVETSVDIYGTKECVCASALSKLGYTYQPYKQAEVYTLNDYIDEVLENHNSVIEDKWHFHRGVVTVDKETVYKSFHYESTKETVSKKLLKSFGGYIFDGEDENGIFLDYKEIGPINSQQLVFGKNIIDALIESNQAEVFNVIFPLGAKIGDTEERLEIAGKFIQDDDSVELYGKRMLKIEFDEITDVDELREKAEETLESNKLLLSSLTLNAVDLSKLSTDLSVQDINPADRIIVKIPHLNINYLALVQSVVDNASAPENSSVTLGAKISLFTDTTQEITVALNETQQAVNGKVTYFNSQPSEYNVNDIWVLAEDIDGYTAGELLTATQSSDIFDIAHWDKKVKYTDDEFAENSTDRLNTTVNELVSNISLLSDRLDLAFSKITTVGDDLETLNSLKLEVDATKILVQTVSAKADSVNNSLNSEIATREEYLRYEDGVLSLGEKNSLNSVEISNDGIELKSGTEIPTKLDQNKMQTQAMTVTGDLQFSGLIFSKRANGNIGLRQISSPTEEV